MSDCRTLRDLLGPYVYNDLGTGERALVEAHLAACDRCRSEFASALALIARLPTTVVQPSPETRERIARVVLDQARQEAARKQGPFGLVRPLLAPALVGAVALVIGIWIGQQLPNGLPRDHPSRIPVTRRPVQEAQPDRVGVQVKLEDPAPQAESPRRKALAEVPRVRHNERRRDRRPRESAPAAIVRVVSTAPLVRVPRPTGFDDVRLAAATVETMP